MLRMLLFMVALVTIGCGGGSSDVTVHVFPPPGSTTVHASLVIAAPDDTVQRIETEAPGTVTATVVDGSSVTAVMPQSNNFVAVDTTLDVNGGDEIELGYVTADETELGSFTVEWPLDPSETDGYQVLEPCGGRFVGPDVHSLTFTVTAACKTDPFEIIVTTSTNPGRPPLKFIEAAVGFSPGGSVTLEGPFRDGMMFTPNLVGLGDLGAQNGVFRYVPTVRAGGFANIPLQAIAKTATMVIDLAGYDTARFHHRRVEVIDGATSAYTLDVPSTVLAVPSTPTFDPATRTVTATFAGQVVGDALGYTLSYGYGHGPYVWWSIQGPIETSPVLKLPPIDEMYLPQPNMGCQYVNGASCLVTVGVYDSSTLDGYGDFKTHPTYADLPLPVIYPIGTVIRNSSKDLIVF
jgi:hypothetical protein